MPIAMNSNVLIYVQSIPLACRKQKMSSLLSSSANQTLRTAKIEKTAKVANALAMKNRNNLGNRSGEDIQPPSQEGDATHSNFRRSGSLDNLNASTTQRSRTYAVQTRMLHPEAQYFQLTYNDFSPTHNRIHGALGLLLVKIKNWQNKREIFSKGSSKNQEVQLSLLSRRWKYFPKQTKGPCEGELYRSRVP